jgi:hypothetical protein
MTLEFGGSSIALDREILEKTTELIDGEFLCRVLQVHD